jgi:hypothetical protein
MLQSCGLKGQWRNFAKSNRLFPVIHDIKRFQNLDSNLRRYLTVKVIPRYGLLAADLVMHYGPLRGI